MSHIGIEPFRAISHDLWIRFTCRFGYEMLNTGLSPDYWLRES